MTDHTDNKEIASQMILAHRGLGSWSAVAKLCGLNSKGEPWSPTMAWWWGNGRRTTPDSVAEAWQANVTPATLKAWAPRQRVPRVSIEVSPHTRNALRNSIKKHGDTWDDAFKRILADTEPGSVSHLFGLLDGRTLEMVAEELEVAIYARGADGYYLCDADILAVQWMLDRAALELSMRKTPDWVREE